MPTKSQSVKECQRCTGTTKSGARCRKRTCRGTLCWQHLKKQEGLRVKKSTIPGAGLGLFAAKPFAKGKQVAPYVGEKMTKAQVDKRYKGKTAEYVLCQNKKKCVDARKTNAGAARFANDGKGKKNNAKFSGLNIKTTKNGAR